MEGMGTGPVHPKKSDLHPALLYSLQHPKLIETDSIFIKKEPKKHKMEGSGVPVPLKKTKTNTVASDAFSHKFSFL